jgi:nicotinamidase/pyrazinamidase
MKKILLIVDAQNDFAVPEYGTLAVPGGLDIVPFANKLLLTKNKYDLKIATQDWHPQEHVSFAGRWGRKIFEVVNGNTMWPDHCIKGTWGADFVNNLYTQYCGFIIRKGTNLEIDSYSAFWENDKKTPTYLDRIIDDDDIIDIIGIATDVCVKATAIDALKKTKNVNVLLAGCAGVTPETTEAAITEMRSLGIIIG